VHSYDIITAENVGAGIPLKMVNFAFLTVFSNIMFFSIFSPLAAEDHLLNKYEDNARASLSFFQKNIKIAVFNL
jgi:hypothetical protein